RDESSVATDPLHTAGVLVGQHIRSPSRVRARTAAHLGRARVRARTSCSIVSHQRLQKVCVGAQQALDLSPITTSITNSNPLIGCTYNDPLADLFRTFKEIDQRERLRASHLMPEQSVELVLR